MIERDSTAISRVKKYFIEEIVDSPDGELHTGNYLLVKSAYIDRFHQIHLETFSDKFTVDQAVPLANYFNKHGDLPGSIR